MATGGHSLVCSDTWLAIRSSWTPSGYEPDVSRLMQQMQVTDLGGGVGGSKVDVADQAAPLVRQAQLCPYKGVRRIRQDLLITNVGAA